MRKRTDLITVKEFDSREDLFPINADNWYCPIYMIGI